MRCLNPERIPNKKNVGGHAYIDVPCGKCVNCLSSRRNDWSFRISQEHKRAIDSFFITLTYEDDLQLNVSVKHCQLFLKRFRMFREIWLNDKYGVLKQPKLRYFLTSEYSDKLRPHYHILMFNVGMDIEDATKLVDKAWQSGFIYLGTVTDASIHYVTKYAMKAFPDIKGLEKPFSLMSRKPGIGYDYIEKMYDYHNKSKAFFCTSNGGIKMDLPRYYRDKLFSEDQIKINSINSVQRSLKEDQEFYEKLKINGETDEWYSLSKKQRIESVIKNLKTKKHGKNF